MCVCVCVCVCIELIDFTLHYNIIVDSFLFHFISLFILFSSSPVRLSITVNVFDGTGCA